MQGLNRHTGNSLSGIDHLYQSITDILTTPLGTRVMRRDYGSEVFDLLDRPMTPELTVDLHAAIAIALDRWEPRFSLEQVNVVSAVAGKMTIDLIGRYEGQSITLEGVAL